MSNMSRYCKAYPAGRLAAFPGWAAQVAPETEYVFLHDSYVVTRSIFADEDVLWSDPTPEWMEFCRRDLEFAVPEEVCLMNADPPLEPASVDGSGSDG